MSLLSRLSDPLAPEPVVLSQLHAADTLRAELHGRAHGILEQERKRHHDAGSVATLSLVNNALLKLRNRKTGADRKGTGGPRWSTREAFFKDFFFMARRVLVDRALARRGPKRAVLKAAGDLQEEFLAPLHAAGQLDLDALVDAAVGRPDIAAALKDDLEWLDRQYAGQRLAEIVQHRIFLKATQMEIALELGLTEKQVRTREALGYALLSKSLLPILQKTPQPPAPKRRPSK